MDTSFRICLLSIVAVSLNSCGEVGTKAPEMPPRSIKYMKIKTLATHDTRHLAGIVKAGTNSKIAFEIGGRVILIAKKLGENITSGSILAKLDTRSIELEIKKAEFALGQAVATLKDARSKLNQQQKLRKGRFTTKTALDTAKASFGNAKGQVGIARSELALKKRDLKKTRLLAPFAGTVSKKHVDTFEEVKAGEAIYTLQAKGEYEVEVSVAESLIEFIKIGDIVDIKFAPLNGQLVKGFVTEISPQARDANAFPVTIRLKKTPVGLRSGMSAKVTISFIGEATGRAYSIPISALKPDLEKKQGTIFVYDPKTKMVRQRAVKVIGMKGNKPEIIGDFKPGDIIATAGVGQMYDGMEVRLLDSAKPF